jgi:hypothetical protein
MSKPPNASASLVKVHPLALVAFRIAFIAPHTIFFSRNIRCRFRMAMI